MIREVLEKQKEQLKKRCTKERGNRGITLIALVITIIVLLILAGISISMLTGDNSILTNAQKAKSETELASEEERIRIALAGAYDTSGNFDVEKFTEQLDKFGMTDSYSQPFGKGSDVIVETKDDKEYIISATTGTMLDITTEDGKLQLALSKATVDGKLDVDELTKQLTEMGITNFNKQPNGDVTITTTDGKEYIISKTKGDMNEITTNTQKLKLAISNATDTNGNFNISTFKSELTKFAPVAGTEEENIKVAGKDKIVATIAGKVMVKYEDGTTREVGTTTNGATLDAGWTKTDELNSSNAWYSYNGQTVNMPKLKGNMIGVKYSTTSGNRWANAVTSDGSMWVWIPRFAYKISNYHQSTAGTVDVIFLDTANNPLNSADRGKTIVTNPGAVTYSGNTQNQYLVHPAFTANAENGGGFGEISGFWFAKYEASGSLTALKSEAAVTSLRNTSIGDFYSNVRKQKYGETAGSDGSFAQSHLIKNSEWGAVAFLTKSNAGTPNTPVAKNALEGYYTGGSNGNKTEVYTTNVTQSTTQNAYGVYDMNGGSWEYVASYVDNKHDNIATYGSDMATNRTSNKFYTVYKSTNTTGSEDIKFESLDYELNKGMKGDAVYEISSTETGSTSWWSAHSFFPYSASPFFIRGGYRGDPDTGVFAFGHGYGGGYVLESCRVALVP